MITTTLVDHAALGRVNLRCLPDGGNLEIVLREQQYIGAAAWEGETFVGSLWFYRVPVPKLTNRHAPPWSGYGREGADFATYRQALAGVSGYALGLSCFHVGRLLATIASDEPDARYFGRGIGTQLLLAAVGHARQAGYQAVLAYGGPDNVHSFNQWGGMMPAKVFLRNGFVSLGSTSLTALVEAEGIELPPFVREEMTQKKLADERVHHMILKIA